MAGNGLSLRLFGAFDLRDRATGERIDLKARSGDYIFAYLALQEGREVEKTLIAELFWGGTSGGESLKKCLQEMETNLGPVHAACLQKGRTIALNLAGMDCDLLDFERLCASDDEADLLKAIALHAAPLLHGWGWSEHQSVWEPFRRRMTWLFLAALRKQSARYAARGDYHAAAALMEKHIIARPEEERGWRTLLLYLDEADERVLAQEARQRYEKHLRANGQRLPDTLPVPSFGEASIIPPRPGGPLPPNSAYYIEREADAQLRRALHHFEGIIRLKGPRYSGKSSLLARGLKYARGLGYRVVVTDFADATESALETMSGFCHYLIEQITEQTGITVPARRLLSSQPGIELQAYLSRSLLTESQGDSCRPGDGSQVVWAMDNVDRLFACRWREDFFRLMRSWHNLRATQPDQPWGRLCQMIACSMEARLYLRDLNQSPFNTSEQVEVGDFLPEQTAWLHEKWGSPLKAVPPADRDRFTTTLGGHPYLLQLGLYALRVEGRSVSDLLAHWEQGDGPLGDHLREIVRTLLRDDELLRAVRALLQDGVPCSEESFLRLRSAGILSGAHAGDQRFRCRLYERYLSRHLA